MPQPLPRAQVVHPAFDVLIDQEALTRRTIEIAKDISARYPKEPPMLVAVIEGARVFAQKLQRLLPGNPPIHQIRASSYGDGQVSSGQVDIVESAPIECQGRDVLLVEDIVDTGRTIRALEEWFNAKGASSTAVATMLSKPSRRVVDVDLQHVGFDIDDLFVIGFGMDLAGEYRDLPTVSIYDEATASASPVVGK